jgi:hypothetical protein
MGKAQARALDAAPPPGGVRICTFCISKSSKQTQMQGPWMPHLLLVVSEFVLCMSKASKLSTNAGALDAAPPPGGVRICTLYE